MSSPALASNPFPILGFGSLHHLILRFGVPEVLRGFLQRGPCRRTSTYGTCTRGGAAAAAAASSFGHRRRRCALPWDGGGNGTGVGGGGRGRGVARTRPPRHHTFWDSARLTAIGIQVVDKVRDGCSTPRLLLLSVRAFTDARRTTQLVEIHGVFEGSHPPRVYRILHFRVFDR